MGKAQTGPMTKDTFSLMTLMLLRSGLEPRLPQAGAKELGDRIQPRSLELLLHGGQTLTAKGSIYGLSPKLLTYKVGSQRRAEK